MRKLAMAIGLASTALASPALARDDAFYIGVEGGAMAVDDFDLRGSTGATFASVGNDHGFDVDGIIGYDFGGFRLEAEVAYKEAAYETFTFGGVTTDTVGEAPALSFMANALLDFEIHRGISGFVGGGAGIARVTDKTPGYSDSDSSFAWQVIAGVRAPLSKNVDVSLKYRFFNSDNLNLVSADGTSFESRYRSHSILVGPIFNF